MELSKSGYKASHLVNANLIIDGRTYHGAIEECDILIPKAKTIEHTGGLAAVEVFTGLEKMEFNAKIKGMVADIIAGASFDNSYKNIKIKGSLNGADGKQPVDMTFEAQIKPEHDAFNSGSKGENSTSVVFICKYYELKINSNDIMLVDIDNHILKVNGTDVLADERTHLGL